MAALVGALIVLAQSPPATQWSRDWVVRQVAARWQLDLAAGRLDLDLVTRRVSLTDVRLSAPGHADAPFFTARLVSVTLPWSVVRGDVRLTPLEVEGARVLLVREGGVLVNLPPPSGMPAPETPRRLDVRGLEVRGLDVDYFDRTGDLDVTVRDLRAALSERDSRIFAGASGTLTAMSIGVRLGDRATTSGPVEGRMAFDGSNVSLQALTVPFPEARVVADGRINRVLDDVRFALTLAGTLDFASMAAWTPPPVPVSGAGAFAGTFEGPLGAYALRADFSSDALTIGRVKQMSLGGVLTLTSPRAVIEPLTITTPAQGGTARRGVFDGRFAYEFGGSSAFDLGGAFRDLDLDVALALYEQDPVSAAAWQQGTLSLTRDAPLAPMRMRARGRSTPLVRADRVALEGSWDATLERDRWVVRHDHRLLDSARAFGTLQWAAGAEPARTALTGPVTLDISDVGPAIRAARRSGIGMSAALVALKGTAQGALTVGGTLERMLVTGHVESLDLVLPTGAGATASAEIAYDEDSLSASSFALDTPGARVTGQVQMGMVSSRLSGAFEASIDSLPTFLAPWAEASSVAGTLQIAGTIGGTTDVPDVPLRVQSTPLTYDTQRLGTLAGDARLLGTDLRIDRLVLDQGPGQLRASGRVDYESYAYDATVEGHGLTWTRPVPGAQVEAVSVDVSFAGTGTLEVPGGAGTLTIVPLGGGVADLVGTADVRWQFANGTLAATAFLPKLRAWAQANLEPRAPYEFRGTALVSRLDVQPLALTAGALTEAVSGTVGFSAAFQGTLNDVGNATAFVNLQDLEVSVGGLPVRLDRPARFTVRADDFSVDDLAMRAGDSTLGLSGRFRDGLDQPLRAAFAGHMGDVFALARAFGAVPRGVSATGEVAATWESRGGLASARSTVTLTDGTATMAGLPPIEALTAAATFDGATLAIDTLSAVWQGGAIAGTARIPRELLESGTGSAGGTGARAGRVDLAMKGLTEQALRPWLPADLLAKLEARVSATLALSLNSLGLEGVSGTLVLDEAAITAAGVPISQARPGRMSMSNRVLRFDDVSFSAGAPVVIGGTVTFGDSTALDVTLTGTPGLRPFSVLSPLISVDGIATLDVRVTGTPEAPRFAGRIDVEDAEVVMRNPRVIASDISGPVLLQGNRVELPGLTGFINGGVLDASGSVTLDGLQVREGAITFQARGVAVEYPRNVDSEIDALLIFTSGSGRPLLTGDVRVLRGAYRATVSLPALVARNAATLVPQAQATYVDGVRLDIALSTEDDLVVDNNYGRFEAGADLRLHGTVGRPGVTGRAELRDGGQVFMLGGRYRLSASTISFTNPAAIEPDLNIAMVTQSNGAEVTLTLSGTLDRLQTDVASSDPAATSQSVMGVLLGGNSLGREDAVALLSGELLGVTGRAVGLDSLRLERGFDADTIREDPGLIADSTDPSTRLTVSKRLRADVEVILSQALGQAGALSAVVSYKPFRGVELRATSRDNNDRAYAIRHELSFGGSPAAVVPRRTLPQVADVKLDGVATEDEPRLRSALRLTAGRQFDFVRWREDVERVHEAYRTRGFFEVRVRVSRADQPDGRTVLVYRITPGPRTELRVEGTDVSPGLRRRLETAWSDSVFDRFLIEELQREVARDLVSRNVIGATVEATVPESTETRKVAQVVVRNGQNAGSRELTFDGAQALTSDALRDALRARGLADDAWVDPSVMVEPLRTEYARAGYRAASIRPGTPRVDGGKGVLPVSITEGPVTRLGQVSFEHVDDNVRASVEAAGRLPAGQPYRDADVVAAHRRIEAVYRTRGFNDVSVTPRIAVDDADGTAAVVFVVQAGPEQRLSDVVVDGTRRTRPSAVLRALSLEPGAPVDFAQWAKARKRVFDTNVFRQVEVRPEVLPGTGPDGTQAVRARVSVTEWPAWQVRYGLQLDDKGLTLPGGETAGGRQQDLGVIADVQNRNAFGRAFTYGLYGRLQPDVRSSNAYLTFPTLFGRTVQTNVFASASREDLSFDGGSEADLRRAKELVSVEQRILRHRSFEVAYSYRLSHEVLKPFDPEDPFLQEVVVGRFTGAGFVDRRDDPFDATRGWFGSLSAEELSEFASTTDSIKLLATFYRYRPLGRVTLASAVRLGGSFLDTLSFGERFFVGGADTVRGYSENAAGARDLRGFATGGNALVVLNQEVRGPIYRWLKGVLFIDAGNTFASNADISLRDLQVGYGAGLRLDTPFSVFRLDMGVPVQGGSRRWYFGIGQVF